MLVSILVLIPAVFPALFRNHLALTLETVFITKTSFRQTVNITLFQYRLKMGSVQFHGVVYTKSKVSKMPLNKPATLTVHDVKGP